MPMKQHLLTFAMIVATPFLSSLAFDWSTHIDGWNRFVENYEQCKRAKKQYDSATNDIAWATRILTEINAENPTTAANLKIGEFEEMEVFRARVEQQRKQDEKARQDKRVKFENQKQQYIYEAQRHLMDNKKFALEVSAFTNRLQIAYLNINEKDLPYFDRPSMSFKDIPNPFYLDYDWGATTRKVKFVVNAEKNDFDSVPMPVNANEYRGSKIDVYDVDAYKNYAGSDSFSYWLKKTHRRLNIDVAPNVSLKFKNLSDAGIFKSGISSGTIKAWFYCEFRVGLPTDWIITQGHYVRERWKNGAIRVLNMLSYGVDDDTTYFDRAIWHEADIGIIVPISIISSKVIIEGESTKSMDIKIISPAGIWGLEKRSAR